MRVVMFVHSLVSCWNHGNAHFLRGVASELVARGHQVAIYEPSDGWSRNNLVRDHGMRALSAYQQAYPQLESTTYRLETLDLAGVLEGVDLVLVHEWNHPALVARLGRLRARRRFVLLFHDTHHRAVTAPYEMAHYRLEHYDAVLAFGEALRNVYLARGWARRAYTWHEAADTRVFRPQLAPELNGQLVWIGNWGDDERTRELRELVLKPVAHLGLRATMYGVRYPAGARQMISRAGVRYGGWLPNHLVPQAFVRHRVTVHVPRRPYVELLPGIPTIRPFEALACGIPLITSAWEDREGLFSAGQDYLVARDGREMRHLLRMLLREPEWARELAEHGRRTILDRHTCAHRVDDLLAIYDELHAEASGPQTASKEA